MILQMKQRFFSICLTEFMDRAQDFFDLLRGYSVLTSSNDGGQSSNFDENLPLMIQ